MRIKARALFLENNRELNRHIISNTLVTVNFEIFNDPSY